MVDISPVELLRYDAALAGPPAETSAPPWSDVSPLDWASRRTTNPYTVLELHAMDASASPTGRYASARSALQRWRRTGVLHGEGPAMAVYRITDPEAGTTHEGLVCCMALDTQVLLHEHVDEDRARGRALRLREVPVDTTPVVALHFGRTAALHATITRTTAADSPALALTDEEGLLHEVWLLADGDDHRVAAAAMAGQEVVLADGHHRVAAARVHAQRTGTRPQTLAMLMDAEHCGPTLHAVHRLVNLTLADPIDRLGDVDGVHCTPFDGDLRMLRSATVGDTAHRRFGVLTREGRWIVEVARDVGMALLADAAVAPVLRGLDVVVLHEVLLPIIGAYHDESAPDSVVLAAAGLPDERDVLGEADALVLLEPATPAQVMQVSRAGQLMPAKSTWFRPKPRAGLVMRAL